MIALQYHETQKSSILTINYHDFMFIFQQTEELNKILKKAGRFLISSKNIRVCSLEEHLKVKGKKVSEQFTNNKGKKLLVME